MPSRVPSRFVPLVSFLATLACFSSTSPGQVVITRSRDNLPVITKIMPCGLKRGQTTEVTLDGDRLDGLHQILAGEGIRLARVVLVETKSAKLELEVAADAPLGMASLHVLGKAGISNPRLVRVDDLAQSVEKEDNSTRAMATPLAVPGAASGVLTPTDIDWFTFAVSAGQKVAFEVEAARLGSSLKPVLTLFDSRGRELAKSVASTGGIAPDTRLTYTFAEAGEYALRIHDLIYAGADFGVYHLRAGEIHYAQTMFPLGGQKGTKTSVTLTGGSLAAPMVYEVDLTGELVWSRTRLRIPLGGDILESPLLFEVGEFPEHLEQEPNDAPAQAAAILPSSILVNGRLDSPGDRDCFRIHLAAGARVLIRAIANRLGSPVDAVISVLNPEGGELATADDRETAGTEPPVVRRAIPQPLEDDPFLDFTAPAEGDFLVAIEDRYLAGGPEYAYRLEIGPPTSNFELIAQPGVALAVVPNPQQPDNQGQKVVDSFAGEGTGALSIDRGGSGVIVVRAIRGTYTGAIAITAEDLPPGVQVAPATIVEGQSETTLNFVVDFEAPSAGSFVRIVGVGQAEQTPIKRFAEQPVVMSAIPINGITQRTLSRVALGVSMQGAELAVRGEISGSMAQGTGATLKVSARRREGIKGDIAITLPGLPAGVSGSGLMIPADALAAEIPLLVGPEAIPGAHSMLIMGSLAIEGQKDPVIAVFPVGFEIKPLVELQLASQQLEISQGGSASISIQVKRNAPLTEAIELTLANLPKGVTAPNGVISPGIESFSLVLNADASAQASPIRRIVPIKAKTKLGDKTIDLPAMRIALKVKKP